MTPALRLPPVRDGARLLALGVHRPDGVLDNAELETRMATSDRWIRERTGIVTRRVAGRAESVVDMAAVAGGKALAAAGVDPADVGLVVVATCTHPRSLPGASAEVASRVGADRAGAVDVGAACAGFGYGLALAADAVRCGSADHVLVVGADKFTDLVDPADRGTAVIFGDGAGAAVVGASPDGPGIGPPVWGSDGTRSGLIAQEPSWLEARDDPSAAVPRLYMDGPAVFRWAVTALAPVAAAACRAAGVTPADVDVFVPHQANLRIVEALARGLRLRDDVVVARDVVDTGNTSAASIPLALDRLVGSGEARPGDLALLFGFGSGLTWAGQVVVVP